MGIVYPVQRQPGELGFLLLYLMYLMYLDNQAGTGMWNLGTR